MDKIESKRRTQKFAIDVIKFVEDLPAGRSLNVLSNQLLRSSSSVGANYRSAAKENQLQTLLIKLLLLRKKLMNLFIGLSRWKNQA